MFFWDVWCWCSSKNEPMGGGLKWPFLPIQPPSQLLTDWAAPTCYTSKEHIFIVEKIFEKLINSLRWKNWKKANSPFYPIPHDVICTKTLRHLRQVLECLKWKKKLHFSKHHFPKDSESGLKSVNISVL